MKLHLYVAHVSLFVSWNGTVSSSNRTMTVTFLYNSINVNIKYFSASSFIIHKSIYIYKKV